MLQTQSKLMFTVVVSERGHEPKSVLLCWCCIKTSVDPNCKSDSPSDDHEWLHQYPINPWNSYFTVDRPVVLSTPWTHCAPACFAPPGEPQHIVQWKCNAHLMDKAEVSRWESSAVIEEAARSERSSELPGRRLHDLHTAPNLVRAPTPRELLTDLSV